MIYKIQIFTHTHIYIIMAAEGGVDNEYAWLDDKIDYNGDDDDDEEEVNKTQPFQPGASSTPYQPGASSTPYHGGEHHEMTSFPSEQSGLPEPSYAETPLLGDFMHKDDRPSLIKRPWKEISGKHPKVDASNLFR